MRNLLVTVVKNMHGNRALKKSPDKLDVKGAAHAGRQVLTERERGQEDQTHRGEKRGGALGKMA